MHCKTSLFSLQGWVCSVPKIYTPQPKSCYYRCPALITTDEIDGNTVVVERFHNHLEEEDATIVARKKVSLTFQIF